MDLIISQTTRQHTGVFKACLQRRRLSKIFVSIVTQEGDFGHIPGLTVRQLMDVIR